MAPNFQTLLAAFPGLDTSLSQRSASTSFRSSLLDDLNDGGANSPQMDGGNSLDLPVHPFLRRVIREAVATATPASLAAESTTTKPPESTEPPAPTEPPGPGMGEKVLEKTKELVEKGAEFASEKTKVPLWGIFMIFIGIIILCCGCCCFCIRRQWRKFKSSEKGKGMVKTMAGNKLFGKFVSDKVQPDADTATLTTNVEEPEPEEEEEVKEIQKIGRLNYKLEYDFNSTNVSKITERIRYYP